MADKNVTSAVESKQKSKKEPMSIKKIITIIIIVVLALLMVGGVYYVVVLVSQSKAEKASAWGSYDGKDIRIENNNVFYNTLMNDSNLVTAQMSGDYNTLYSSYYSAYQAQVVYEAISEEAKAAKIAAPQELVNKLILNMGIYNGEDGTFSEEVFNESSEAQRVGVNTFYTNYYPYSVAISDMQSTIISSAEKDFVVQLAKDTRTFDYFIIDFNTYPDDKAADYGAENPLLFSKTSVSILSATTEEKINEAYAALTSGTTWEDAVTTYSEDSYKSNAGKVGDLQFYSILPNLNDSNDVQTIAALEVGSFSTPIQGPAGYTIYKLDSAVEDPDFTDADTLAAVKYYINNNKIDDVTPYVDAAIVTATDKAAQDFTAAAEAVNGTVVSVSASNNNVGQSQYLGGIDYYDSTGFLAAAASDQTVSRELFTAEEGYVTGPMAVADVENTYIIAKVTGINKENEATSYTTSMLYDYYAATQPAYDRFYNILTSDKHVDNFYTQFFNMLFSQSST